MDVLEVKISVTSVRRDYSFKPQNTVITKALIRKLNNKSLEPLLFERLHSIKLSISKYLVTSFVDFSIYG